jgi:retinoid hydroxylase
MSSTHSEPVATAYAGRADLPLPPGPVSARERARFTSMFLLDELAATTKLYQQYGPVARLSRTILMVGPQANNFLLNSDPSQVQSGPVFEAGPPGLRSLDGEEHKRDRRLIQHAFRPESLSGYVVVMKETTRRRMERWGGEIDLYEEVRDLVVDIVLQTMLGTDLGHKFPEMVKDYWLLTNRGPGRIRLPYSKYWRGMRAQVRLWDQLREIIARRRDNPGPDAVSALVTARDTQADYALGEEQILNYLFMLLEAGRDTSINLLTFAIAVLAIRPDLQQRLLDEDIEGLEEATLQGLYNLPFTINLLREVERMYPPAPYIARYAAADLSFQGYRLPKGSGLIASTYLTHRLPEVFPNPELFDPDRFAPPREEHRTPNALIGFGGGPHLCIGKGFSWLEASVVLHTLARGCRLRCKGQMMPGIRYKGGGASPRKRIILQVTRP